jgi:pantetheine-phosphate adenylyltransferase
VAQRSPDRGPTIAVYPGSFDPITLGHVDIVERAARMFDEVVVAVGQHPTKVGFFTVDERSELVAASVAHVPNARADRFKGLVVQYCRTLGASVIVRGLRAIGDFEPEFQMGLANRDLADEVETVFLIPRVDRMYVSRSLVREIAGHGGDVSRYVAPAVVAAVEAKIRRGGP